MRLIVRPGTTADLDALLNLAGLAGPGLTSLPVCRETLGARLALSCESFAGTVSAEAAWYTLMLQASETGEVVGVASVRGAIGLTRPHYSFRVTRQSQHCEAAAVDFVHDVLMLVNECAGWSEVGSLFVHPAHRGGGSGALLARARYMLIAAAPARFSPTVMAELRGWFNACGTSPFWTGLGEKLFRMPFATVERMVAGGASSLMAQLAPRHPIYTELLSPEVRGAIGKPHRDGVAAKAMLEREGFRWNGLIDVFDGGPTVSCPRDQITTLRVAGLRRIVAGNPGPGSRHLLANPDLARFCVMRAPICDEDDVAVVDFGSLRQLGLGEGDSLLAAL